jgi:hypothetical protein
MCMPYQARPVDRPRDGRPQGVFTNFKMTLLVKFYQFPSLAQINNLLPSLPPLPPQDGLDHRVTRDSAEISSSTMLADAALTCAPPHQNSGPPQGLNGGAVAAAPSSGPPSGLGAGAGAENSIGAAAHLTGQGHWGSSAAGTSGGGAPGHYAPMPPTPPTPSSFQQPYGEGSGGNSNQGPFSYMPSSSSTGQKRSERPPPTSGGGGYLNYSPDGQPPIKRQPSAPSPTISQPPNNPHPPSQSGFSPSQPPTQPGLPHPQSKQTDNYLINGSQRRSTAQPSPSGSSGGQPPPALPLASQGPSGHPQTSPGQQAGSSRNVRNSQWHKIC